MSRKQRLPDQMTCVRCLEEKEVADLDRLLWCEECQGRARRRASKVGWLAGGAFALLLTLYIALAIQPAWDLIPTGWAATIGAAFYLSGRVSREIAYGTMRLRNRRAAEARPPPPGAASPERD